MPMAWTGTVAPGLREARQRNELRQSLDRLLWEGGEGFGGFLWGGGGVGCCGRGAKFGGVSQGRVFAACPRHDGHGALGQVVVDQVLQAWHGQQLWRGRRRVAPEAAGAADADTPLVALVLHAAAPMPRGCTWASLLPARAWPPTWAESSVIRPANGALKRCSIFMASSTTSVCPACTVSPTATPTAAMRPVSGAVTAPLPPSLARVRRGSTGTKHQARPALCR